MKQIPLLILLCASISVLPLHEVIAKTKKIPAIETVDSVQEQIDEDMLRDLPLDPLSDSRGQDFQSMLISTYETSPALRAARAETRALFQQLPIADSNWKPNVSANGSVTGTDGSTDPGSSETYTTTAGSVTLTQPLFRGGRTISEINVAQASIRAGIANLQLRESDILLSAITAYVDLVRDDAVVDLNENNLNVLSRQMNAAQKRFKVGDVTRTDVALAESRRARAQADVTAARGALKSSRAQFVKITGLDVVPLSLPAASVEMPKTLENAIEVAQQQNPELRAAVYNKRAAGYTINSRLGSHLPEVSLRGDLSSAKDPSPLLDQQDSASVGVVATIPLYEGGATTARVREARQNFVARTANVDAAERKLIADVTSEWENWQSAKAEIKARETQARAAGVAQFGTKKEAEFGARSVLDSLDAEQELIEARTSALTARRNEVVARYALLAACGQLNPMVLGFADKIPDYNYEIKRARRGF